MFAFSLLFSHIKYHFVNFFPMVYFIFFILLTILVILCHASLHFSEALVPRIEHKPLAEAIPVLNREKLVSCVLRLMLLLIYLNI